MITLGIYTLVLLIIGLMSTLITYFALLYRDPHDSVGIVLGVYYLLVSIVLLVTLVSLDFSAV